MAEYDFTKVHFRGLAQKARFVALTEREFALTLYYDKATMDKLGITDSIQYLFNQLGWENTPLKTRFFYL